jgi:hypothetical protein
MYNYFSAEINEKSRKGFQGPVKHLFKNRRKSSQISNNEISLPFYKCYLSYEYREVSPSAAVCRGTRRSLMTHPGSSGIQAEREYEGWGVRTEHHELQKVGNNKKGRKNDGFKGIYQ